MGTYKANDLKSVYEEITGNFVVKAHFTTDMIGGQPGGEAGVRAFCTHHLHLTGDELEHAIKRILNEEIGEKETDSTKGTGELQEKQSFGVNVLRRDSEGVAWIADWMIKANFKCAATRMGIFQKRRGSKGDVAEAGSVQGHGPSVGEKPFQIRVLNPDGTPFKDRLWQRFHGRVIVPSGFKSIVQDSEYVPAGCRFEFVMRFITTKFTEQDIVDIMSLARNIGLGSVRSMERGKFEVEEMDVNLNK